MENKTFANHLRSAISAHQAWLSSLKDMVEKKQATPIQMDDTKCGFGHFYYSVVPESAEVKKVWGTIQEKHKKLHSFGHQVVNALNQGDFDKAEEICRGAESYSKGLISDIQDLEKIVERLEQQGLRF